MFECPICTKHRISALAANYAALNRGVNRCGKPPNKGEVARPKGVQWGIPPPLYGNAFWNRAVNSRLS